MMKFLRSQSQTVLVVVLAVIGLGFLFYGNSGQLLTSGGGRVNNDYGRIDGDDLSVADLYDAVRNTKNAIVISGRGEQLGQPGASAQVAQLAWRELLLLHEADRLHITVSDQQVVDFIRSIPSLQKDGTFSPDVYDKSMKSLGMRLRAAPDANGDPTASAKTIFENVIRNNLRVDAVSRALFGNLHGSSKDVSDQYAKLYGPTNVSTISFDPKNYLATAQVAPADIEAEYKANTSDPAYRTKEKRKVDYVLFMLTPDQAKLPDDQKKAAKQALGQKALDFALAFQADPSATTASTFVAPEFLDEAKKRGLNPGTTDFFTDDAAPAGVPPSHAFNATAFALSKDNAISKVVDLEDGVAVLHLNEIQPSELRPLDQVKADIQKKLQVKKSQEAAQMAAQITSKVLQQQVDKGADFKTAAAGMKLKVDTIPQFVPMTAGQTDPKLQAIAYASVSLKPGKVSDAVPSQISDNFLVLHLDSRAQPDPAGLAEFEKRYRSSGDDQLREIAAGDWANWKSKQPGTRKPADLDAFGTVE